MRRWPRMPKRIVHPCNHLRRQRSLQKNEHCVNGSCTQQGVACDQDDECARGLSCKDGACQYGAPDKPAEPTPCNPQIENCDEEQPIQGQQEYTESCTSTADCKGTLECISSDQGQICTKRCPEVDGNQECANGSPNFPMECRRQQTASDDDVRMCISRPDTFCKTCLEIGSTTECGIPGKDVCMASADGQSNFCATDCSDAKTCLGDAICATEYVDGTAYRVCKPNQGICINCYDRDGDGYGAEGFPNDGCEHTDRFDCDDNDDGVYPGAVSQCDQKDTACEGRPDFQYTTETGIYNTMEHCGACNNDCYGKFPNAEASCDIHDAGAGQQFAQCGFTCLPGFLDHNGDARDGCEMDLSSPNNCGAPDIRCGDINTDASACVPNPAANPNDPDARLFVCELECSDGFADCNDNPRDGCEVDLSNVASCGACVIQQCEPGWANCDGDSSNGCEIKPEDPTYDSKAEPASYNYCQQCVPGHTTKVDGSNPDQQCCMYNNGDYKPVVSKYHKGFRPSTPGNLAYNGAPITMASQVIASLRRQPVEPQTSRFRWKAETISCHPHNNAGMRTSLFKSQPKTIR